MCPNVWKSLPEPISIGRCRELLGDEADALTDDEVRRSRATQRRWRRSLIVMASQDVRFTDTDAATTHLAAGRRSGLSWPMIGAVIYVRVSTKEQTENLSLPTQLRACEEYCRRAGLRDPRALQRRGRERQDHGPHGAPEAAEVLPNAQGQGPLRGRVQPHAVRAGEVRPLRASRAPEVARHLAAVSDGADRRHVHRQADGRRAGAFAQFDNDVRSERTRAGMRAALELGRWTFPAPLGYLNAPKWSSTSLVHDPERGATRASRRSRTWRRASSRSRK